MQFRLTGIATNRNIQAATIRNGRQTLVHIVEPLTHVRGSEITKSKSGATLVRR